MIESMRATRNLTLANVSSIEAMNDQMKALNDTAVVMGQSFDAARNGDLFYLPPEAFTNPDFQVGLKMFLSPDGKSARFFITHEGDPATPSGIARVDAERKAAREALKMSSLSTAKIYLGGTAATYKDMHDGAKYDLMIAVVAALTLIFMIMLVLIRSFVAAVVIVGTAASSIAATARACPTAATESAARIPPMVEASSIRGSHRRRSREGCRATVAGAVMSSISRPPVESRGCPIVAAMVLT